MDTLTLEPLWTLTPTRVEPAGSPAGDAPVEALRACGWWESSLELRQGLQVSELASQWVPVGFEVPAGWWLQ